MRRSTLSVTQERKDDFDALKRDDEGESADACLGRLIEFYTTHAGEGDDTADTSDGDVLGRQDLLELFEEYGVATSGDVDDVRTAVPRETADEVESRMRR